MVRGYVYSGRYVLKYLLDVTGGMIIREGTFIWQKIVYGLTAIYIGIFLGRRIW